MGCDPEFFFTKAGEVVGSEKIIDIKRGLSAGINRGKFIVDGVQAELNPLPNTCRANLANEISTCFRALARKIEADKELRVEFRPAVTVSKKELASLDEKSQVFGCAPSFNQDKKSQGAVHKVDPKKYLHRGAGGHIHLSDPNKGTPYQTGAVDAVLKNVPERVVTILDILLGNTCVLIDRDPSNIIRRKTYGRAGEYRTPPHGLEYRTLSNFWLRSYPLMSFVMAMARFSVSLMTSTTPGSDFEKELLSLVNMKNIRKAINTNDFNLAWENFQDIKPFLAKYATRNRDPIAADNIEAFEYFVSKGLDHWFKDDPFKHWITLPDGHSGGWESFISNKVIPEMIGSKRTKAPRTRAPKGTTLNITK